MDFPISIYLLQATHGLVYGMLIFLVASGLTLVLGMMGVLNIAHAAFYMLGAYFAYTFSVYLGSFWLGLVLGPVIVGALAVLMERFFIRRTYKSGHEIQLLLTFGLFFILGEVIRLVWGSSPLTVAIPPILSGDIPYFGLRYPIYRLFILGFSVAILIVAALILSRTKIGIIIRAAVSDPDMVDALGTNIPMVFSGVFAGGAILAAISGVIAAPFFNVYSGMGDDALLDCFVIIVVGGFGSLPGALIASLMIGQLNSFGILFIPKLAIIFQFLLMVAVLIVKPTGLFGEKQ
jgi:branched-chain amino acid transport system permease protein